MLSHREGHALLLARREARAPVQHIVQPHLCAVALEALQVRLWRRPRDTRAADSLRRGAARVRQLLPGAVGSVDSVDLAAVYGGADRAAAPS